MTLISASDLSVGFGERELFKGASFLIRKGDKIGFVGSNGVGKTTLLKLLVGELQPTSGEIHKKKNIRIGYMRQHACADSEKSALEETLEAFSLALKIEEDLKKTEMALLCAETHELLERQAALREEFISLGGLEMESRAKSALLGLGLTENELSLPVTALSGGQRSKIDLAKLLLSQPEILLLDEPTNHLDIPSIEWLEQYLEAFTGAVLIISHDRYFLDKITSRTFEIKNNRIVVNEGNYTRHLELEAERQKTIEREYQKSLKEIDRIEGIIEQQRTFSMERNYRTIEHKQKSIDRIKEKLVIPESQEKAVSFNFKPHSDTGNDVLKAEGLTKKYDGRTLFDNISLDIKRKEFVFLLGKNGTGKTTLLRELISNSQVKFGSRVSYGYFDQLGLNLNPNNTILDEIWNQYTFLDETTIRSALAAFLFTGDSVFSKIELLSGGERARVALCKLMLSGNNLLLLDEPTNHLDLRSREALETALENFEGTIIAVSHDRYFINKLSTRILNLEEGTLKSYIGNYDDYLKYKERESAKEVPSVKEKQMGKGGKDYHEKKQKRQEFSKATTRLKKIEEEIESTELKISETESLLMQVASDYEKTLELSTFLDELNQTLENLLKEWEEAEKTLEEMEEYN